ncbi:hypothetical protein H0H81_006554 [Sphagnurus paluster]|uniref:BTB domain-containing protein n=1 Tax=Sphagnurus paluster TaxID=117069 RepID=A0A9P7GW83_9AGAR|nr:hypothetical protein H0H81_006554 [Sphagnurus paluster]
MITMQGKTVTPFDNPAADIILRSSDKIPVDFRVFKLLLSLASPFFAAAFTLPQPEADDTIMPVMEMEEDADTLALLLGLCYPVSVCAPPRLRTLRDLRMVMKAAVKFEMDGIQQHLRTLLVEPRFIEQQPLRVYAIACRYGWIKEAREAARNTLRYPADTPLVDELELISGGTYHRLLQYRKECGETASSAVAALAMQRPASLGGWVWDECTACVAGKKVCVGPRSCWLEWMLAVADIVRERPCGDMVRKAHLKDVKICAECMRDVMEHIEDYMVVLGGKVEKQIAKVKLRFWLDES